MGILYLFLMLSLIIFLVSYALKLTVEDAIPISNFIVIIIIYINGIVSLRLNVGIILIFMIVMMGILYFSFYEKSKREEVRKIYSKPGIIYFSLIFIFSISFPYNREFVAWDEFSHWGLVVKNMYYLNKFGNAVEATTLFKGYPPAMSIFQYFFMKLFGDYRENLAYSALIFFNLSLLAPIVKNINNIFKILLLTLLCIIFPTIISIELYTTIYIDLSLGTLSAYILYSNIKYENYDKNKILIISLGLFLLPLMKSSGTFLGVMILTIVLLDLRKEKISVKNKIFKGSLITLSFILGKYSWDIYTKLTTNFVGAWGGMNNLTLNKIIGFWVYGIGEKYQHEVKINFIRALSEPRFEFSILKNNPVSMMHLLFFILGCSLFLYFLSNNKKIIITTLVGVNLMGVIYIYSLLNLYLYTFSEYEAVRLASFTRYLNTFLILVFFYYTL